MARYKVLLTGNILVTDATHPKDGATIPLDTDNRDYNEYLEWLSDETVTIPNTPDYELEDFENKVRLERTNRLNDTDWYVIRHRDEQDEGGGTTLTTQEYDDLLTYRKDLRDLPANITATSSDSIQPYGTFENPIYPTQPSFM